MKHIFNKLNNTHVPGFVNNFLTDKKDILDSNCLTNNVLMYNSFYSGLVQTLISAIPSNYLFNEILDTNIPYVRTRNFPNNRITPYHFNTLALIVLHNGIYNKKHMSNRLEQLQEFTKDKNFVNDIKTQQIPTGIYAVGELEDSQVHYYSIINMKETPLYLVKKYKNIRKSGYMIFNGCRDGIPNGFYNIINKKYINVAESCMIGMNAQPFQGLCQINAMMTLFGFNDMKICKNIRSTTQKALQYIFENTCIHKEQRYMYCEQIALVWVKHLLEKHTNYTINEMFVRDEISDMLEYSELIKYELHNDYKRNNILTSFCIDWLRNCFNLKKNQDFPLYYFVVLITNIPNVKHFKIWSIG